MWSSLLYPYLMSTHSDARKGNFKAKNVRSSDSSARKVPDASTAARAFLDSRFSITTREYMYTARDIMVRLYSHDVGNSVSCGPLSDLYSVWTGMGVNGPASLLHRINVNERG